MARQHFLAGDPPSLVEVHFVFTSAEANPAQESVGIVLVPHEHSNGYSERQTPFLLPSMAPPVNLAQLLVTSAFVPAQLSASQ